MEEKRKSLLNKIELIINKQNKGEIDSENAIMDIQEEINDYHNWEEVQMRKARESKMKSQSITIEAKVEYKGKLPARERI